jgi:hypothetical protein
VTKKEQIIISAGAMIGGLLLCGYALTTTLGLVVSTICIVLGLGFAVSGFISFILALKRPTVKKKQE